MASMGGPGVLGGLGWSAVMRRFFAVVLVVLVCARPRTRAYAWAGRVDASGQGRSLQH